MQYRTALPLSLGLLLSPIPSARAQGLLAPAPAAAAPFTPGSGRLVAPAAGSPFALASGRLAAPAAGSDTLPCIGCEPRPKHFWAAAGELGLAMLIPWSYNYFVRNAEFAHVNPQTWWDNITGPWVWDDNSFQTNQFAHPYHGNLYFNAFRTNGYSFWQSFPAAWAGAYLWECCGETHPKAPNDLFNTSLGGITLGEMLYRLSNLTLDNRATGSERVWREIGAALLNPMNGFNRLVRDQSGKVGSNPPDWRPDWVQAALDLGGRALGTKGNSVDVLADNQQDAYFQLAVVYGRPAVVTGKPFSHFRMEAELATTKDRQKLQRLVARGNLGGSVLHDGVRARHAFAVYMNYDYHFLPNRDTAFNAVIYEYGAQSFQGGLVSTFRLSDKWTLNTEVLARAVAIGAVRADYYEITGEGRNYDFGPGLGGTVNASINYGRRFLTTTSLGGIWLHTVSGTDSDHYLSQGFFDSRYYITHRVGVGARYQWYYRRSDYHQLDPGFTGPSRTFLTVPGLKLFFTTAIPSLAD